jgi:3-phosphoshikimate 1-carboxyvinyltransferase
MNRVTIRNKTKIIKGEIGLPASKSISNRALILQYLSGNKLSIHNLSEAEDTELMVALLGSIKENQDASSAKVIDCHNSGTVFRFLTALLAITPGKWLITGSERMKERPVGILADTLNRLGAAIHYKNKSGYPPLSIEGKKISGGEIEIDGSVSSQYITALLLISPTLKNGLTLKLKNKISSLPYIQMTLQLLSRIGIQSAFKDKAIRIAFQDFEARELSVEPDWTAASYWYEMAALSGEADILLKGLKDESIQGDSVLPDIFRQLGVMTIFEQEGIRLIKSGDVVKYFMYDFSNFPDLAPAIITTCAALNISSRFTGIESLRIKESDRIFALQNELKKTGFQIELAGNSELCILPILENLHKDVEFNKPAVMQNPEPFKTYGDHRMAMALAPLSLLIGSVQIEDPQVVTKSYPGFWKDLIKAGFELSDYEI